MNVCYMYFNGQLGYNSQRDDWNDKLFQTQIVVKDYTLVPNTYFLFYSF
jgi:hypothetical protein